MHSVRMLHGLYGTPEDVNNELVTPTDVDGAIQVDGEDISEFFGRPGVQRGLRMAGAAFAPVSGFIWGSLVGLIVGPSGGRGAAAIDAGLYGALTNFCQSLLCVPDAMQDNCQYIRGIPATTLVSGYVAYQHRTGRRG